MEKTHISLSSLQNLIDGALRSELDNHYWVVAEIAEINSNYSGHSYLELVEKDENTDEISARIRAIIWSKISRFILPYFKTTTGSELTEGLTVLIKGSINYHPLYGLSFVISDIDPTYTVGDVAKKRNEIINRLTSEGIIYMNQDVRIPPVPNRIAVISSGDAAGYEDFRNHLLSNPYGYHFSIELFKTVMQGPHTANSLLKSMEEIASDNSLYDLVVIVRGGGSSVDLGWFDDYDIAFMITQFPIAVITGIGHERDKSVTDMVAHTSCKTPTAVADFIIESCADTEKHILNVGKDINRRAREIVVEKRAGLLNISSKLISRSRLQVKSEKERININSELIKSEIKHLLKNSDHKVINISNYLKKYSYSNISVKRKELILLEESLKHLNPQNVLKRGYSISLKDGKLLKKSEEINKGDHIRTILSEGEFDSEILDINE